MLKIRNAVHSVDGRLSATNVGGTRNVVEAARREIPIVYTLHDYWVMCPRGQFMQRHCDSLAGQIQRFVAEPQMSQQLGRHGYLHSESGDIPSLEEHVEDVEAIYERVLDLRDKAHIDKRDGPWRITFDTNPDTCNLRCIMCEGGEGAEEWAERIVPVTSDVKISWNGASAETQESIMVDSNWDQVLENVRTFIDVRDRHASEGGNFCRVTFQLTFLERNIVELAANLGVNRVKGHHLWVHFDEMEEESMRRSPEAIQRWNEAVLEAREAVQKHRLPNGEPVLLENIYLLDEDATEDIAPGGECPFLGREVWVSAKGRTFGEFGNLNEKSLTEIWKGEE